MKTTHIVSVPNAGLDLDNPIEIAINSDDPTKLLLKNTTQSLVQKEDLLKAIEILEMHLELSNATTPDSVVVEEL